MQQTTRYVSKPVRDLTNYFAYHRNMQMRHRFNEDDRSRMNIFFSRRLKQGISAAALRQMVDRFYQTQATETEFPAALFCTNKVQDTLLPEAEVSTEDEVLRWLLDGMSSSGPFADSKAMRRAVILHAEESLLRYPDVVATILRKDLPFDDTASMLVALDRLIAWNLSDGGDVGQDRQILRTIPLPKELASPGRSPKSIRKLHDDVKRAILGIPMRRVKRS